MPLATHIASVQCWPVAHARPQAPQWALFVSSVVSQPLDSTPSQSPVSVPHDSVQRPAMHTPDAVGALGQVIDVKPLPSALHTRSALPLAHPSVAPGTHTRAIQLPLRQT